MSQNEQTVLSLVDFIKEKKKADCKVCQLPEAVRQQLHEGRAKKITRRDQLEWLQTVIGADIHHSDLDSHYAGRHE